MNLLVDRGRGMMVDRGRGVVVGGGGVADHPTDNTKHREEVEECLEIVTGVTESHGWVVSGDGMW